MTFYGDLIYTNIMKKFLVFVLLALPMISGCVSIYSQRMQEIDTAYANKEINAKERIDLKLRLDEITFKAVHRDRPAVVVNNNPG